MEHFTLFFKSYWKTKNCFFGIIEWHLHVLSISFYWLELKLLKGKQSFVSHYLQENGSITLRFLATGESQQSLSFSYRIGRTTVSNIQILLQKHAMQFLKLSKLIMSELQVLQANGGIFPNNSTKRMAEYFRTIQRTMELSTCNWGNRRKAHSNWMS